MPRFQHILFPVDFSRKCQTLRPFVLSMARRFNAKITLLHILQPPPIWYDGAEGMYGAPLDVPKLKEDLTSKLSTFIGEPSYASIEYLVQEDHPATGIVSFAESHGVDLIMMPTHGYGVFRRLLLGSVAAKVLHDAKCPVWTAAHTEDIEAAASADVRSIVCAVDLEAGSLPLLRFADELARSLGSTMRLAHAIGTQPANAGRDLNLDFRQFLLHVGREEIAKLQKDAATNFAADVEEGSPAVVVSETARRFQADLVITGRGRIHERLGRLRTNAYAIIRDSPCPVLSI